MREEETPLLTKSWAGCETSARGCLQPEATVCEADGEGGAGRR